MENTNKSKVIVFATILEAQASINTLNAKEVESNFYEYDTGYILISGMGSVSAASSLASKISKISEVWNYGISGALNASLILGDVCYVERIGKHISFPENIDEHSVNFSENVFPTIAGLEGDYKLVSSDYPIHNDIDRGLLASDYDLVDMEAYGLAHVCQKHNVAFGSVKVVSDFARLNGPQLIREQISDLSQKISVILEEREGAVS